MLYTCLLTVQFYMYYTRTIKSILYHINIQLTLLLFFKVIKRLLLEKEVKNKLIQCYNFHTKVNVYKKTDSSQYFSTLDPLNSAT